MYQLLIVEDEPLHRNNLKKLLTETSLFEITIARTAMEAMELCEKKSFEIVMTDIRMPVIDGIAFLTQLKNTGYQGLTVIISAYADFDYAQKAIDLGACAYLLKPFTREQLIALLSKLTNLLKQNELNAAMSKSIHSSDSFSHRMQLFLEKYVLGQLPPEEWQQVCNYYEIPPSGYLLFASCSRAYSEIPPFQQLYGKTVSHLKETGSFLCHIPFEQRDGTLFVLSDQNLAQLRLRANTALLAGVSQYQEDLSQNFSESFQQAEEAFYHLTFFENSCGLKCFEDFTTADAPSRHMAKVLSIPFCCPTPEEIENYMDLLIQTVSEQEIHLSVTSAKLILGDHLIHLFSSVLKTTEFSDSYLGYYQITTMISASRTLSQIRTEAKNYLLSYFGGTLSVQKERQDTFIKILKYLNGHIAEDLSLDSVANVFHFNTNYFSTYFKKNANLSFISYLTLIRMEYSLKLLQETNQKIYEIAALCGYHDVRYYSKVFKKQYGISPEEYRRNTLNIL